ncbi:uncharacterized protein LOC128991137 [Macrosteles quadrilineatus]|uniref:uncharacterized protein LOC128991137 n=1 Tax=Macrosteles quadrilineatus TaxID=74068 RepID=UPI0023E204BE|nr:uncharacterized protein LOC128991137 [Macrosteles quadrilineatus]
MKLIAVGVIHILLLMPLLSNTRPTPDIALEDHADPPQLEDISSETRETRYIPDENELNEVNIDKEANQESSNPSEADQEPSNPSETGSRLGKDNDNVPFAFDPVNELFRSHKEKSVQKHPKTKHGAAQESAAGVQDLKLSGEPLRDDEQVECYRQQNIDPPMVDDAPSVPIVSIQEKQSSKENCQREQRNSKPLIYKEKGFKKLRNREDDDEITSLYSDAEKKRKVDKQTLVNSVPNELEHLNPLTVYKPIGVIPEFPVYDEDIDFHPDPLQGILEEKYWLDPQEQEAVIRKYTDLANNMHPPDGYNVKRSAPGEYVPKSVDCRCAFREASPISRECPCGEMAACEDCSKGKWRKQNTSEADGDVEFPGKYGTRQLLSVEGEIYDSGLEEDDTKDELGSNEAVLQNDYDESENQSSEVYDSDDEESQVEGGVPGFTSNFFGRRLLSVKDDANNEEYNEYGEHDVVHDEILDTNDIEEDNPVHFIDDISSDERKGAPKSSYRRSAMFNDDQVKAMKILFGNEFNSSTVSQNSFKSGLSDDVSKAEDYIKSTYGRKRVKPHSIKEFNILQKPFPDNSQKSVKYYVPNKIGNILQKGGVKKPKEKPSTVEPDLQFETDRNETIANVSFAMHDINVFVTTEMAGLVKYVKRREQPVIRGKGVRSYQLPFMKHPPVKPVQESDSLLNGNVQDVNNTADSKSVNYSMTPVPSFDSSVNISDITTSNISRTNPADNTTGTIIVEITPLYFSTPNPKEKEENDDEDSFDAEIANDIVETVIAESQSGSVVGHNLGLYRRNETLSKYAKISPESEQLLKKVTQCILDHIRDHLESKSCTLLDEELLQFLKWMVLTGESYKDYLARMKPELRQFKYSLYEEGPPPPPDLEINTQIPVNSNKSVKS